jgi:glycosylphosphatidylinositol transamidase (GPIT) subunit GPI8
MVKMMAALGCRHEDIGRIMDMTPKTLRKHFRNELDTGAIEANNKVVQSLFEMATKGKNTTAAIFWTKARCGWRERPREVDTLPETSQIVVKVE